MSMLQKFFGKKGSGNEKAKGKTCPFCGAINTLEVKFCPSCGGEFHIVLDNFDAFISYRRETGSELASLLKIQFENRFHKTIFLDVNELQVGRFDEELLNRIENTPNFIVILSRASLDRCANKSDWFKREIMHALNTGRNIIPVMTEGFVFPSDELWALLPTEMRVLPSLNGVNYSHIHQDSALRKIASYMKTQTDISRKKISPDLKKDEKPVLDFDPVKKEIKEDALQDQKGSKNGNEANDKASHIRPIIKTSQIISKLTGASGIISHNVIPSKPFSQLSPSSINIVDNKPIQVGTHKPLPDNSESKPGKESGFDVELKLRDNTSHRLNGIECGFELKSNNFLSGNHKSRLIRNLHYFPFNTFFGTLFIPFNKIISFSVFKNKELKRKDLNADLAIRLSSAEYCIVNFIDANQIITGSIGGNRELKIYGKDDFGETEILIKKIEELVFKSWSKNINPFLLPRVKITDRKFLIKAYKPLPEELVKFGYNYLADATGEEFILTKIVSYGWLNNDNTFNIGKLNMDELQYQLDFEKLEFLKTDAEIIRDGRLAPKMNIELKYKNGATRKSDFGWGNSAILGVSEYGVALVELKNILLIEAIE